MKELDANKERLIANPLFALSLGSRELFHTNFLAWLLESYPEMIASLTSSSLAREFEVHREKYNFDLLIVFKDGGSPSSLVVEVKVKDTPRIEQLERYDEKILANKQILGASPEKLLLSLTKAPLGIPNSWRVANLEQLASEIDKASAGCTFAEDHFTLVRLYRDLCRELNSLVSKIIETDISSRDFLFARTGQEATCKYVDETLEDLRFLATLEKHRASKLCEEFKRRSKDHCFGRFRPIFKNGFDRKQAHVGGSIQIPTDRESNFPKLKLEVHLQGKQYRRMLSFDGFKFSNRTEGKDQKKIEDFIQATDGWNWLFGNTHQNGHFCHSGAPNGYFTDRKHISTSQQKSKSLLSYAPVYIYQYTDIGKQSGVPTDEVIDAVIADLKFAAHLLSDETYVLRFQEWLPD